ncbi:MAG: ABC transporter permease [Clostridia bacterium]|nr:ABC transporter permease [Clostridia bacterium]
MKRDMTKIENIKEEDLNDINKVTNAPEMDENLPGDIPQQALDDTRRVKVISPGVLVAKRFFRNKLALVGLSILIFMFAFCFLGGWIIPYDQKEVFYKNDIILFDYATATERTTYENYYIVDKDSIHYSVRNMVNSYITQMKAAGETSRVVYDSSNNKYTIKKVDDKVYVLTFDMVEEIGAYSNYFAFGVYDTASSTATLNESVTNESLFITAVQTSITENTMTFVFDGDTFIVKRGSTKVIYNITKVLVDGNFAYNDETLGGAFESAVKANLSAESFMFEGKTYLLNNDNQGNYEILQDLGVQEALFASTFVFDRYDTIAELSGDFKIAVFGAMEGGAANFVFGAKSYSVEEDESGVTVISDITGGTAVPFANMSTFAVRRFNGEDTLSISFKMSLSQAVLNMLEDNITETHFNYYTILLDDEGNEMLDDEDNPVYGVAEFTLERKLSNFVLRNYQEKYLINIYDKPSATHWLGTDANGMDVLTRIMFGGRISLIIGFVVIFLALFIGVILGGIAGYFGKWIDNLIMRLVDIFNCIPTLPLLIIMGAFFDAVRMVPYTRIMYLMVILGILGWSGIARLVRGQILSLREQEFMIAAEATGLKASRRIFRHLVPNVMPQLIVNATMGLGGIILTESTLSFLGLGAKYPLATWGAMINAVSTASAMVEYTYIWIPVGLLICLTVIAFNFVGDGLRDAFDPKMKR